VGIDIQEARAMKGLMKWTMVAAVIVVGYTLYIAIRLKLLPDVEILKEMQQVDESGDRAQERGMMERSDARIDDAKIDLQRTLKRIEREYHLQEPDVIAMLKLAIQERVLRKYYSS